MAEAIIRHGNIREREASNASNMEKLIQEKEEDEEVQYDEHGNKRESVEDGFVYNHVGFTDDEAKVLLEKYGKNQLPEKIVPKWRLFLDQFRAPMPIMIWIAIIIEAAITNWIDMGILLVIQFTNASISFYELNKAGDAVAALKNSLKPTATCKRNGKWEVVDATLLVPGDLVLLASGSGELGFGRKFCISFFGEHSDEVLSLLPRLNLF
jgi:H+-transporting ATPase